MSPLAVVSVFLLTWSGGVISSDSICHKSLTLGDVYKSPFANIYDLQPQQFLHFSIHSHLQLLDGETIGKAAYITHLHARHVLCAMCMPS